MVRQLNVEMDWLLWITLTHTRDALLRIIMKDLRGFDVFPSEAGVLFVIHAARPPDPTPADISRWMFRESQTISAILKRMERRGLITRVRDKKRKNGIRVIPTPKGTEIYNKTAKREFMGRVLSVLPFSKRQQLRNLLEQLRKAALKELNMEDEAFFPSIENSEPE